MQAGYPPVVQFQTRMMQAAGDAQLAQERRATDAPKLTGGRRLRHFPQTPVAVVLRWKGGS